MHRGGTQIVMSITAFEASILAAYLGTVGGLISYSIGLDIILLGRQLLIWLPT